MQNTSTHKSCGGIVYRKEKDSFEVLLLHRLKTNEWPYDSWHLPKGTQEENESDDKTLLREIFEETGYKVMIGNFVGTLSSTYTRDGNTVQKETSYYLCSPIKRLNNIVTEHDELAWMTINEAISLTSLFPLYEREEKILKMSLPLLSHEKTLLSE